jgi:hypothetical protein
MQFANNNAVSIIVYIVSGANSVRSDFNFLSSEFYVNNPQVENISPATSFILSSGGYATRGADQVTVDLGVIRLFTTRVQTGATRPRALISPSQAKLGRSARPA